MNEEALVVAAKVKQARTEIDRWKESDSLMQCRIDDLKAENERLKSELEELDFLHHEGGPQSVAALEQALRNACEFIEKEWIGMPLEFLQAAHDVAAAGRAALGDRHE